MRVFVLLYYIMFVACVEVIYCLLKVPADKTKTSHYRTFSVYLYHDQVAYSRHMTLNAFRFTVTLITSYCPWRIHNTLLVKTVHSIG